MPACIAVSMEAAEIAVVLCSRSRVALFVWNAICKVAVAPQRLPMNSSQQLLLNNGSLKEQYVVNFQPWADVSMETNVLSGKKKGILSLHCHRDSMHTQLCACFCIPMHAYQILVCDCVQENGCNN